jgi:4a-hydroxytetrahydrobiopterin dehydratase
MRMRRLYAHAASRPSTRWRTPKRPLFDATRFARGGPDMLEARMALLSDAQVEQRLQGSDWRRDGDEIVRDLSFDDFAAAIAFVDRVAAAAESANHHPDILVHGWNKVRLTLSTHSEGGLTESDFALAASVDTLS